MIVLDTSAALTALVGVDTDPELLSRVAGAGSIHVPHLIDVEFVSALRGLLLGGKLSDDRARDAMVDFADLRLTRYPLTGLVQRVWAKRHSLTAYDAVFVSLAEALECPLITCDRGMADGAHDAQVELFTAHR